MILQQKISKYKELKEFDKEKNNKNWFIILNKKYIKQSILSKKLKIFIYVCIKKLKYFRTKEQWQRGY